MNKVTLAKNRMAYFRLALIGVFLVYVLVITGCSSLNESEPKTTEESNNQVEVIEEETQEEPDDGLTLEEALKQGRTVRQGGGHYFFSSKNDLYYPLDVALYSETSWSDDGCNLYLPKDSTIEIPTIKQGDVLITVKSRDSYTVLPIIEQGYYGGHQSSNLAFVDEINGIDYEAVGKKPEEVLEEYGIVRQNGYFTSHKKTSFTYGAYEGVKFVEGTTTIDEPYLKAWEDGGAYSSRLTPYSLSVEKTKNNYFTIDTSPLPQGTYILISAGDLREYIAFTVE